MTKEEQLFCELFVNGAAPFGGNALRCYQQVFHTDTVMDNHKANQLLIQDDIKAYVEKLEAENVVEAAHVKRFLTANLKHIIEETTTAEYRDRKGTLLSPAAVRSVAVSASKALMELYPVKEAQINKLNIEGAGEGGVVFNVIVPEVKVENKPNSAE